MMRGFLNQKERRAHLDVEIFIVAFLGRVENIAPVGQRRRVNQSIEPAEPATRTTCRGD